jgi:hypothetical protein
MKLPEPTNETQQAKYNQLMWDIADYRAMFPPKKSPYDLKIEHDIRIIEQFPPQDTETQAEYYQRVRPFLTKAWFGRLVRDMGYERKSTRVAGRVVKVWKFSS